MYNHNLYGEPDRTYLHEQPRSVWNKTDVLERLQCLLKAKVNMLRYDDRGTKTLKDAREEISRLREENIKLKEDNACVRALLDNCTKHADKF